MTLGGLWGAICKAKNVEKPLVLPLFLQNRILDTNCVSKAVFKPTWGNLSTQKAPNGPPYGAPKMTNFETPLKKGNVGNHRRPRHRLALLLLGPWPPWGGVGEGKNKQRGHAWDLTRLCRWPGDPVHGVTRTIPNTEPNGST